MHCIAARLTYPLIAVRLGPGSEPNPDFTADRCWCNAFWRVAVAIVAGVTPLVVPRLTNS